MTLHLIFSPDRSVLDNATACAGSGDTLLLLGDAAYLASSPLLPLSGLLVMVRESDVAARNLCCPDEIKHITDGEWLAMTIAAKKTLSWF